MSDNNEMMMRVIRQFRVVVGACLLLVPVIAVADSPMGMDAVGRFELISQLRPDAWVYQNSSYDRNGRNYDWTGVLGTSGSENIMLDVKGAGCIYRIWFTSDSLSTTSPKVNQLTGTFRFYFDGATSPSFQVPMEQLFSGTHPWYPKPLVGNNKDSSGGWYCYVPMPFRTGCRITHTNSGSLNYYHVTYHRYVTADGITTFNGSQPVGPAVTKWNAAGSDPKPDHGTKVATGTVTIPAGGSASLVSIPGPGVIQQIELFPSNVTSSLLSDVRLQASWDRVGKAVDVPLGAFFGSSLGPANVTALPVGMSGSRLYCYFPMPFQSLGQIALANSSNTAVSAVGYSIRYTPTPPPRSVGRFYAVYNHQERIPEGLDYNFVTTNGTGHLVGVVQALRGWSLSQWYLEGDERIYADNALTPAMHGTGTEDFYNAGWYFQGGLFGKPTHGHPLHFGTEQTIQSDNCYRFFMGDVLPFRNYLRAGIEHGGWNEDQAMLESAAMFYKSPRATMFQTDTLNAMDSSRVPQTATTWTGSTAAYYQGNSDRAYATDAGRWVSPGASSAFAIRTDPPGDYVVLRRRLNYSVPRQQADVYVNGNLAGTWYDAGSSQADGSRATQYPAFRDSDFFIPPALARGKASLQIEIRNSSTESEWTEYTYWAHIVKTGTAAPADFDYDGDVDQEDFAHIQRCMSGPTVPQADLLCQDASLDGDPSVDEKDMALFLGCMTEPGDPADPYCADQ